MYDGSALPVPSSLDEVVIRVSIGIGKSLAEAEAGLARAKSRKPENRFYNIEMYRGERMDDPVEGRNPVVESYIRLEKRLQLAGDPESLDDLQRLKYDFKTGLLNKVGYAVEVEKRRERYAYDERVIILIDGDDMKKANSTLGYEGTDRYLEAIGRALKGQVRQTPFTKTGLREPDVLVNRKNDSGGDEFIVDVGCSYGQAEAVARRCVDAIYAAQAELGRAGPLGGGPGGGSGS